MSWEDYPLKALTRVYGRDKIRIGDKERGLGDG